MPLFFNNRQMQNNHLNTFGNSVNNMTRSQENMINRPGQQQGYMNQGMSGYMRGGAQRLGFGQNGMNQSNGINRQPGMRNGMFGFNQDRMSQLQNGMRPPQGGMQNNMQPPQGTIQNGMQNGMQPPQGFIQNGMQNNMQPPQGFIQNGMQNNMHLPQENMQNNMNRRFGFGQNGMNPQSGMMPTEKFPMTDGSAGGIQSPPAGFNTQKQGFSQGPLPDGVKYEPIDANTMALIQKYQQPDEKSTTEEMSELGVKQLTEDTNGSLDTLTGELEDFIQFERNAGIFYRYLSESAPKLDHKKYLDEICRESDERGSIFKRIYEGYAKKKYETQDTIIDNSINYRDGIQTAIYEESKKLRELSRFYDKIYDMKISRELNCVFYNKIGCLSLLQMINSSMVY